MKVFSVDTTCFLSFLPLPFPVLSKPVCAGLPVLHINVFHNNNYNIQQIARGFKYPG